MSKEELENEQYDRQIRLWGLDAQRRMQNARVLVCGLSGIHVETVKNLVLCGVNLTIEDPKQVSLDDLNVNYFVSEEDVGRSRSHAAADRVRELNPLATVSVGTVCRGSEGVASAISNWASWLTPEYLRQFAAVLLTDCSKSDAVKIDKLCRSIGVALFWSASYGSGEGWFAADLGREYRYKEEGAKAGPASEDRVMGFPSFEELLTVPLADLAVRKLQAPQTYVRFKIFEEFRDKFGRLPYCDDSSGDNAALHEIASRLATSDRADPTTTASAAEAVPASWAEGMPVCSVIGGMLAQEVLKLTTQTGAPINNFFIFSIDDYSGRSLCVKNKN